MSLAMPRFYVYVGLHSLFARRGGEGGGERGGGRGTPVGEGGEVEGERGGPLLSHLVCLQAVTC